jgi:diketogulonate reductase-like aldo/keto reductase
MEDPTVLQIAHAHGKNAAQVLLRYQIQRNIVVIPKSVTKTRIVDNIDVFDFALSDEEMKTIDALDRGARLCPESG